MHVQHYLSFISMILHYNYSEDILNNATIILFWVKTIKQNDDDW